MSLLQADEGPALSIERQDGRSPVFLTCDHASQRIPRALGDLGVAAADLDRHIAWDIGALAVAQGLSVALDATLVASGYSRLVMDMNRPLQRADLCPVSSEATAVPGNVGLDDTARATRRRELFDPYHNAITRLLDARRARPTVLISIHSFTPVYAGVARPWEIALLSNRDRRIAECLLAALRQDSVLQVGDNIPYRLTDEGDYGVPVHGEQRGLPHVLIELRQDGIASAAGQRAWVRRLAPMLVAACTSLLAP